MAFDVQQFSAGATSYTLPGVGPLDTVVFPSLTISHRWLILYSAHVSADHNNRFTTVSLYHNAPLTSTQMTFRPQDSDRAGKNWGGHVIITPGVGDFRVRISDLHSGGNSFLFGLNVVAIDLDTVAADLFTFGTDWLKNESSAVVALTSSVAEFVPITLSLANTYLLFATAKLSNNLNFSSAEMQLYVRTVYSSFISSDFLSLHAETAGPRSGSPGELHLFGCGVVQPPALIGAISRDAKILLKNSAGSQAQWSTESIRLVAISLDKFVSKNFTRNTVEQTLTHPGTGAGHPTTGGDILNATFQTPAVAPYPGPAGHTRLTLGRYRFKGSPFGWIYSMTSDGAADIQSGSPTDELDDNNAYARQSVFFPHARIGAATNPNTQLIAYDIGTPAQYTDPYVKISDVFFSTIWLTLAPRSIATYLTMWIADVFEQTADLNVAIAEETTRTTSLSVTVAEAHSFFTNISAAIAARNTLEASLQATVAQVSQLEADMNATLSGSVYLMPLLRILIALTQSKTTSLDMVIATPLSFTASLDVYITDAVHIVLEADRPRYAPLLTVTDLETT